MTTPNTTCLYPQYAPLTGYNKGCRCARCREGKKITQQKFKENNPDYYKNNVEKLKVYGAIYRKNNVVKTAATSKLYRDNNGEKETARKKLWCKNNVEKLKVYQALYYQENAERKKLKMKIPANSIRHTMRTAKRRMLRIGKHLVPPLNLEEETRMYKFYETRYYLTESTGVMHHVDHRIPATKGGLHHPDNLQILTASENRKKRDKIL